MSRSTVLPWIYFLLALVGLLWILSYLIEYFSSAESWHPLIFLSFIMHNAASSAVAVDAFASGIVFSVMAVTCAARDGVKWPWGYVLITFFIGLCVSLPLYLGFRERMISARKG